MLKVHFLNVGKGNCTVIQFPSGRLAVIDIDNSRIADDEDVLQDPVTFLDAKYPGQGIFRFILTHPDMDHMSGLAELKRKRVISNFWDTNHDKVLDPDKDEFGIYDPEDWRAYLSMRGSATNPKRLFLYRDTSDHFWHEDGVSILAPSSSLDALSHSCKDTDSDKYNHISYVLRIQHEGIVILLGGDATKAAWDDIFSHYQAKNQLGTLKAHVFLAPHHGSENNVNAEVFAHIAPAYVVVSVHRGMDYDYDHYNSLATKGVYSTKHNGTVTVEVSSTVKSIYPEKNP